MTEETTTEVTTDAASEQGTQESAKGTESETQKADATETTEQTQETTDEVTTESKEAEAAPETKADQTEESADARIVPEVDGYELPEGVPTQLAQFAHDTDMTQDQLNATLGFFGAYKDSTEKAQEKVLHEAGVNHVETWGDEKEYNLTLVQSAISQNDPSGAMLDMLENTGYGNHPVILDFLLGVGKSMKEGGFLNGAVHRPQGKSTAASTMFGKSHPSVN